MIYLVIFNGLHAFLGTKDDFVDGYQPIIGKFTNKQEAYDFAEKYNDSLYDFEQENKICDDNDFYASQEYDDLQYLD